MFILFNFFGGGGLFKEALVQKPQLFVTTSRLGYRCHMIWCDPAQSGGNNQASDEMPSVRKVSAAFKSHSYDGKSTFEPGKNAKWRVLGQAHADCKGIIKENFSFLKKKDAGGGRKGQVRLWLQI